MTRSAYGPAWDLEANRRRLEVTRGVTVASMRAQTGKDWTWLVALDRHDPLYDERRAVFMSAGVAARFLDIETDTHDRAVAAVAGYRAPWADIIGSRDTRVAMTRLDDDDALAPWALERIATVAAKVPRRMALILPRGLRVWNGRCTLVRHDSNAMQTLVTPPRDELHVYEYLHRQVRKAAPTRGIDNRLGWVWTRHQDTISGWHNADTPIPAKFRDLFPIDWRLLEGQPLALAGGPPGRYFR